MSTENVDWSKAPEGATHWAPAKGMMCASFMKYEGGKWYCETVSGRNWTADNTNDDHTRYIARPTAWTGSGLPPVGTVCEWRQGLQWERIEILAYNGLDAWIRQESGRGLIVGNIANLRPLRTPEQIEAEERDKAIEALRADTDWILDHASAQAVLAAGYRKTEGGAA